MNANKGPDPNLRHKLRWPLRLTWAGLFSERALRAFWPVWTILFATIAAIALGLFETANVEMLWLGLVGAALVLLWALTRGVRRFHWPTWAEAVARLDATMPGRPIAAVDDALAVGSADQGSVSVWQAHKQRMSARAAAAKAPAPDLQLADRDPFALRYVAATLFMLSVAFGSVMRVIEVLRPGEGTPPVGADSSWEGWAEPPAYTGKPSLYLTKLPAGPLALPQGSHVILRLYGDPAKLSLEQDVAAQAAAPLAATASGPRAFDLIVEHSGALTVAGDGGRSWQVTVTPDNPPTVELTGPMDRKADGKMQQPFLAKDDFGIAAGQAKFTLDLEKTDRRYGLTLPPDPLPPLHFDLPRPARASRTAMAGILAEDASKHPWANLPVAMTLTVTDALGQKASTAPVHISLPGRRFFDPLAAAIIEMRRDILWSTQNGKRTAQILRALTFHPEGFIRNEKAYLMLRVAIRRLEAGTTGNTVSAQVRDEVSDALWDVAILLEDGGLEDALERMHQAEERLSQAIKNGASKDEIRKLMNELRDATDDYLNQLAQKGEQKDPADKFAKNQKTQNITGDQIQQMMDEIQKLMEQGKMAEAQELLDQLQQLMENLKVTQSQDGEGQEGQAGKAMRDLRKTLREQQKLSDDAFQQQQKGGGDPQGAAQPDGTAPSGQGSDGDGTQQQGQQGLADRQQALRDQLDQGMKALPDAQGQDADRARRSLKGAGDAMKGAEDALRKGDIPGAIDRQAEAIEQLREGLRGLNDALAKDNNRLPGADGQAQSDGQNSQVPRDPLGRENGQTGQVGTDKSLLQGEDVYRHARELLDEIRKRSADQTRPDMEREYLRRLMGHF